MSLIVSGKSGKEFALHPEGPTAARCTRIIDLGTVKGEYKGKAKMIHDVRFAFESAVLMPESEGEYAGKPFLIVQKFTASLGEKANLRKFLEAWRGRKFTEAELDGFDLKNVLGKPCFLNIVHSEDGKYANISSVMPLPAGIVAPPAVGEQLFLTLSEEGFDQAVYDKLSDNTKARIAESAEYKALKGTKPAAKPAAAAADLDDDIPF